MRRAISASRLPTRCSAAASVVASRARALPPLVSESMCACRSALLGGELLARRLLRGEILLELPRGRSSRTPARLERRPGACRGPPLGVGPADSGARRIQVGLLRRDRVAAVGERRRLAPTLARRRPARRRARRALLELGDARAGRSAAAARSWPSASSVARAAPAPAVRAASADSSSCGADSQRAVSSCAGRARARRRGPGPRRAASRPGAARPRSPRAPLDACARAASAGSLLVGRDAAPAADGRRRSRSRPRAASLAASADCSSPSSAASRRQVRDLRMQRRRFLAARARALDRGPGPPASSAAVRS